MSVFATHLVLPCANLSLAFSMGIALPTWLVDKNNTYVVLGVYGVIFGVLLPYFVVGLVCKKLRLFVDRRTVGSLVEALKGHDT